MVELFLHSRTCLYGVLLNELTSTALKESCLFCIFSTLFIRRRVKSVEELCGKLVSKFSEN
jgi:hypothetical protein